MREIEYRGKREDNGGWVYGGIMVYGNGDGKRLYIVLQGISPAFIEVIPETVGQYTGVKDKNGVKIFEGDIFRLQIRGATWIRAVEYCGSGFYVKGYACDIAQENLRDILSVIGNIHDSPELLEATDGKA